MPIRLVLAGLIFSGCNGSGDGGSKRTDEGPDARGKSRDAGNSDKTHGDAVADVTRHPDAGVSDSVGSVDTGGGPQTPAAPSAAKFMAAPCPFPASLSYDQDTDTLIAACGGATNALFKSPKISGSGQGPWDIVGNSKGYPSHHIRLSKDYYLINHSMPDGFTIVNTGTSAVTDAVSFSKWPPLSFVPNSPGGAVLVGATLCIAAANLDKIDTDPAKTTFHPGTIICFPYSNGKVDNAKAAVHFTSGKNPTGMALVDQVAIPAGVQRFAVLSSNSYSPASGERAWLDVFKWPSMTKNAVDVGKYTAQISPTLAITAGGLVLFGLQKPQAAVVGVDANAGSVTINQPLNTVQNFISSIALRKNVACLSDFGMFGKGGQLLFVNTDPAGWKGVPVTPLAGAPGPSVVVGDYLYSAVTDSSGTSASIWRANLSNLK